ncbi:MAG: Elongation factor Ts [Bacteriovoracaceae bacterium]|nr:Elongation factor Ts [Bacteriovoracaceae bacterium]
MSAVVELSASEVRALREKTGAGMMDCKKALLETGGDVEKAVEHLRKKGILAAEKKIGREAKQGAVTSYIHAGGKIGVLVEINCETDFVARNETFQTFSRDVAMHIAAANPRYLDRAAVPEDVIAKEREIFADQAKQSGKPEAVIAKITDGKIEKFYGEVCLLEQSFIKNPDITIGAYLKDMISKLGENMMISRFTRFELGRADAK